MVSLTGLTPTDVRTVRGVEPSAYRVRVDLPDPLVAPRVAGVGPTLRAARRVGVPRGRLRLPLAPISTPAPALATNRRFTLPLTLGARLLIVPTLAQFGVETRTLHLTLEAPQRAVEALVILDDYFQDDHAP